MALLTNDFYKNLFTSEGTTGMDVVLDSVPARVTAELNNGLTAPYTPNEVKKCSFPDVSHKIPGARWIPNTLLPEALGTLWYQSYECGPEDSSWGGEPRGNQRNDPCANSQG